mgnify:CR=1 FL=1|tara:strand:- start:50 stop:313 length:264 start_codon:yes stop_codon:yes gene_type:complete
MDNEELKGYKKNLEMAINQALTESPKINSVIHNIREVGYEVFLIIEATIGFNHQEASGSTSTQTDAVRLELTSQDEDFLRSLKISPE